ncbi:FAD-linked reductase [Obba rivulosa]|uniref:FAD-linked reductase n=1 Tax=Obba rivulosa TaxID=1052685 RepID=A0A8E2AHR8_9APHY|nr:FAD-linked reductase [Obba rivulosa]
MPLTYSAVISTVPLGRLSLMDLTGCDIIGSNYAQWSAIRGLQYGPAIKIGMRFTEAWWYTNLKIEGGSSYTDLPLRTVVYPSYPSTTNPSNVLISSYCWTQDAERLGALINGDGTAREELIDLVLRDLSTVHGIDVEQYYDRGSKDNVYFAWNWSTDHNAMGAFAFFGPQQFNDEMYAQICSPAADGKLLFAGEATSSCHAWVAGALDSSWRAVYSFLLTFYGNDSKQMKEFLEKYGRSEYWYDDPEKNPDKSLLTDHLHRALNRSLARGEM